MFNLQRLLIDRMENRILVGTVMFIGILLLVGWTAIKENARMASFQQQFEARAIERGAKLFAANCSTCHGNDGRGITGRAPALNSPHFFGYDYYAEPKQQLAALDTPLLAPRSRINTLNGQVTALQTEQAALEAEQTTLATELQDADETRQAEIEARQAEIAERLAAIPAEVEAINAEIAPIQAEIDAYLAENEAAYAEIQAAIAQIDQQLLPATLAGYPDAATLTATSTAGHYWRLTQANWGSTLEAYITTTLIHGRSQNAALWGGNIMASWSNRASGPMRDDQIADITTYILNWDKGQDWTLEDALAVQQYAIVPGAAAGGEVTGDPVGTDVDAIVAQLTSGEIVGDPARGEQIYNNRGFSQLGQQLGCSGCHVGGAQGPATEEQWVNIPTDRLTLPQFAGYSIEQYIVESIVAPSDYIVPGYEGVQMPLNFGERMSVQDMADIIEYIHSYAPDYVAPEGGSAPADGGEGGEGGEMAPAEPTPEPTPANSADAGAGS